ncbi:hypothetical protein TL16_g11902 [Triparma laevis f. inornata]|uniref:Uncharacterized protein n=1 Tax=Triparma laevis f. inornata TaxID=1714386 RepID=A0A9W7BLV7_9STRA|nr:hypothetical protein TL16_g11902 [Triparma laevis f. inornata]
MIPILVPPSHALPSVRATILDTSPSDPLPLQNVDSIILVYDLHRLSTFESLERHYLPLIEELNIPTILCASKVDKGTNPPPKLLNLLAKYKFVAACISVSSKTLLQVNELFLTSMAIILYPLPPLFSLSTSTLTPLSISAFLRIYRMYTTTKLLSDTGLNEFQTHYFSAPLLSDDIQGLKKIVVKEDQRSVEDGRFTSIGEKQIYESNVYALEIFKRILTRRLRRSSNSSSGFLNIFKMFIVRNQLEMPWVVLKEEGYTLKVNPDPTVDDELMLNHPENLKEWKGRMPKGAEEFLKGMKEVCGDGERVDVYKIVEVISGGLPWEEDGFFEDSWSSVGGELARSVSSNALTGSIIVPPQSPTKPATPQSANSPRLDDSTALLDSGSILLEGEEVEEGEERMMSSDDFIDAYILSYSVAPLKTLQHIHALGWRGLKEVGEEKESEYIRIRVLTGDSATWEKVMSVVSRYQKSRVVVTTVPWGSSNKGDDDDFDLTVFVIVDAKPAVIEEALECCRSLGEDRRRCFVRLEDGSVEGGAGAGGGCEAVVKHCEERDLEAPFVSREEGDAVAWLVKCATSDGGTEGEKRVKPYFRERRQALKRKKMMKGGLAVLVLVVVGFGVSTFVNTRERNGGKGGGRSFLDGLKDTIGLSSRSGNGSSSGGTSSSAALTAASD